MDLYHYINNYESDNDCRDNIEMIKSEVDAKNIVKNYTIYKVHHKNKEFNDSYIGLTHNFAIQKIQYKSNVKNPNIKTKLIERIRNTGGWNAWEMVELEKMNSSKEDVKIRQQEYIKEHNSNLNIRNPVKQNVCKIKNKINQKKEKLNNKMNMHVDKNDEHAKERKNQFIEKNKEKRQSKMNKHRELKKFIIEEDKEDEPIVNVCLDEYICVLSSEFMKGVVKFEISKTPQNTTSFYKLEFAKKLSNVEAEEKIYDILSKERIHSNMKLFRVNLQTVKNIFDLMDGEYYPV